MYGYLCGGYYSPTKICLKSVRRKDDAMKNQCRYKKRKYCNHKSLPLIDNGTSGGAPLSSEAGEGTGVRVKLLLLCLPCNIFAPTLN